MLGELKARGAIVVIISHRPSALEQCDKILVLSNGAQQAFGPRTPLCRRTPCVCRGRRSPAMSRWRANKARKSDHDSIPSHDIEGGRRAQATALEPRDPQVEHRRTCMVVAFVGCYRRLGRDQRTRWRGDREPAP